MPLNTSTVLYFLNTTTVDTGTGIDIRLLSSSTGAADQTQTFTYTHTQDSIERTFDPATAAAATNTNNAGTTLFKCGWALRLSNDMTPTDDANCNAMLVAQTLNVNLYLRSNQTGGTYTGGNFTPTVRASLWKYNPSTDTGTLIAAGTAAPTWAVTGGTNNTFQSVAVPITVASNVEFDPAEVLYVQAGMNSGTIPNPTLGTGTFTITLEANSSNTNLTFGTNGEISQVCFLFGSATGSGSASGAGVPVLPTTGTGTGTGTATGTGGSSKLGTGTSTGTGDATGSGGAVKLGTGNATGVGTASGVPTLVVPTTGTVAIGTGGGETIIVKKNLYLLSD